MPCGTLITVPEIVPQIRFWVAVLLLPRYFYSRFQSTRSIYRIVGQPFLFDILKKTQGPKNSKLKEKTQLLKEKTQLLKEKLKDSANFTDLQHLIRLQYYLGQIFWYNLSKKLSIFTL